MEPIRGPLDYHRYPPHMQHRAATKFSSEPTPLPNRSSQPGPGLDDVAAPRPRVLRRPDEHAADTAPGPFLSAVPPVPADAYPEEDADLYRPRPARPRRRRLKRRPVASAEDAAPDTPLPRHRLPAHALDQPPTPRPRTRRHKALTLRRRGRRPVAGDGGDGGDGALPRHRRAPGRPFWIVVRRVAVGLALLGCCELGAAALTSPRLAVQQVDIVGAEITSPAALKEFTSTLIGQNWIRAHVREATNAVASLPTVRSAQVVRVMSWPPSLQLQIEERQPFARVGGGGDWWVVDRDGVPFRHSGKADADLYAVTAPTLQPQFGQPLPAAAWRPVVDLASVITDARRSETGAQDWALRRIYFDKQGFASLRLAGGTNDQLLLRLGVGQWPEKLRRARQALDFFARTGRHAVALNLISYSRPTWTPRSDEAASTPSATPAPDSPASDNPGAGSATPPDGFSTDGSTGAGSDIGGQTSSSQT